MGQLFECFLSEQETSLRLCLASSDRARRECVFNDRICSTAEMTWQLKNCLPRGAYSPASSFAVLPLALLSCGINWCLSCCKESRLKLLTKQKGLPPLCDFLLLSHYRLVIPWAESAGVGSCWYLKHKNGERTWWFWQQELPARNASTHIKKVKIQFKSILC